MTGGSLIPQLAANDPHRPASDVESIVAISCSAPPSGFLRGLPHPLGAIVFLITHFPQSRNTW